MTPIFVFGTLCHLPLLTLVAGAEQDVKPAHLTGSEVRHVGENSWPMLAEAEDGTAPGFLFEADANALARLDFYEACFGYDRVPAVVSTPDGRQEVDVWRPRADLGQPGAPWSVEAWAADHADLTLIAASEVMRQMEFAPPEEVGRRFWMIRARAQAYLNAGAWAPKLAIGSGLKRDDVALDAHRFPYTKFFAVEEMRIRARQFDGAWSPPQERAIFRVADAVSVLPYDPVRDRILLVEQIRLGAYAHGDAYPWMLEPIAGMIDAGETAEAAGRRETLEEANIEVQDMHFVARYYPSPGGISQLLFSYVALADLPDGVTGVAGKDDEGEDILSHLLSFDQAREMFEAGDMVNAPLVLSYQWLALNRDRLRGGA